jgi:hypothetical protein
VERLKDVTVWSNACCSLAAHFRSDTGMENIVKLLSVRKLKTLNVSITCLERLRKTAKYLQWLWPLSEQISDSRNLL